MNIQIAKKPITETESDQASPDLANEYSLAMQKANHRNCVQSQWGKSVSKECVQKVGPQTTTPNQVTETTLLDRGPGRFIHVKSAPTVVCIAAGSVERLSRPKPPKYGRHKPKSHFP